jgi:HEAT repeat protein
MRINLLTLSLVVLAGCSRSSADVARPTFPEARVQAEPAEEAPTTAVDPALADEAAMLAQRLSDADLYVRAEAAAALAGHEHGFPYLLEGLRNPSWEVRLTCLQVMDRSRLVEHATEALPVLQRLMRDTNPQLRQQAVYRLSWFGEQARSTLSQLENLANQDPSPDVRAAAADVVVELNATADRLQQLLQNRNAMIRLRAVRSLAGLGMEARNALPTLQFLAAKDPDSAVRQSAGQAYQSIRRAER